MWTKIYTHFYAKVKPSHLFLLHQYFQHILPLIYQLVCPAITIFIGFSNITLFITFTFTNTRFPNKSLITYFFVNQFFNWQLHLFLFQRCLLLQALASSLLLPLQVSYDFTCLVLLVLDVGLNTLIFII